MKIFLRKCLYIFQCHATFDSFIGSAHVTSVPRIKIFRPCRERGGCYELDRVSCFYGLRGNYVGVVKELKVATRDVTIATKCSPMERSTLQRGPFPQELLSRLTNSVLGKDFRDGLVQSSKVWEAVKHNFALLIQTDSEPVSNLVLESI